jgi:DNA repair exonuclease SbcCD ATPase subunit
MSPPTLKPLTGDRITELWALFGPPPVLSTEEKEAYDSLRKGFVAYYRPTNTLHLTLIRELVDTEWEIFRLVRHRTRGIERRFRTRIDDWVSRLKSINAQRKHEIKSLHPSRDKYSELETAVSNTESKIEEIRKRQPDELDYNRAIDEAAKFLEVLDKWLNTATARRNSVLKLLEYYCGPTDDRNEVTEVEYKEVEQDGVKQIPAPPLAPAELVADDVTTQNRSEPVELSKE